MSVFIDTNIFVAARNKRDIGHRRALELLKEALEGRYGQAYTSDYVFDEAVTVALRRTRRPDIAMITGRLILVSHPRIIMLNVNDDIFKAAWDKFQRLAERGLSFTDCATLAIVEQYGIDYVMSFDRHFDGLVKRIY